MSLLAALLLLTTPGLPPGEEPPPRPNVLWLTVEDMSPWLPCYGDDTVPTPNLDRLAAEGVRYTDAFATSPVCAAARSSLITGMFAPRIGTMHHRTGKPSAAAVEADPDAYAGIPAYQGVPPAFVRCFPEHLRAAGYHATNNAKTDYQLRSPVTTWDRSGGRAHWRDAAEGQPWFAVFNHGGTHESQAFPDARRRPAVVDPATLDVPPIWPDTPAVRDALARTYDNIAAMDAWVGEHLDALDAAGLADRTVVFFFSDHGVGLPRGKRSPTDLGTRVPLLVRHPDGRGAGTTDDRVLSFVDLGPTVLSLCGVEPDERLDGRAFLGPRARPGTGLAFAHADRFDAVRDAARTVTDGRFRYTLNLDVELPYLLPVAYRRRLPMTADLEALAGTEPATPGLWPWTTAERPREELYDTDLDPWEVRNLAGDPAHAERLDTLRAALAAWREDTGDLGAVASEEELVRTHLWPPDGVQPTTAAPALERRADGLHLVSATEGASVGYRLPGEDRWRVARGPLPAELGDIELEVEAHRLGWRPARATVTLGP